MASIRSDDCNQLRENITERLRIYIIWELIHVQMNTSQVKTQLSQEQLYWSDAWSSSEKRVSNDN